MLMSVLGVRGGGEGVSGHLSMSGTCQQIRLKAHIFKGKAVNSGSVRDSFIISQKVLENQREIAMEVTGNSGEQCLDPGPWTLDSCVQRTLKRLKSKHNPHRGTERPSEQVDMVASGQNNCSKHNQEAGSHQEVGASGF